MGNGRASKPALWKHDVTRELCGVAYGEMAYAHSEGGTILKPVNARPQT